MSEMRRDPTTDNWVIIAPERKRRPRGEHLAPKRKAVAVPFDPSCPFCPGNESKLPAIIAELASTHPPGWRTRVVPNKYPALGTDISICKQGPAFYEVIAGRGRHEVVIESPRHDHDLMMMSDGEIRDVLTSCQGRYTVLMNEGAVRSVIVFRNRGIAAGASLQHPHSQVIALDIIPLLVRARQATMLSYFQRQGRCVLCDLVAFERSDGSRVVAENDGFLTLVPFAATTPCEMWLLPKRHRASFGEIQEAELELLAAALRDALLRLSAALDDPPYNYVIDTAANLEAGTQHLHWRLRIVPQSTVPAGFELASGLPINPSLPEQDAAVLHRRVNN